MAKYELMVILPGELTEREALEHLQGVKGHVTANGGTVVDELIWGKRDMAYRIKKQDTGFYAAYHFTLGEDANFDEIRQEIRLDPNIMRNLLIRIDDDYTFAAFEEDRKKAEASKTEALAKRAKKSRKDEPVGGKGPAVSGGKGEGESGSLRSPVVVKKKSATDAVLEDPDLKL